MSSRKQRGKTLTVAIVVGLTAVAGVAAWQLSRPNLTAPEYLERGVAFAVSGDPRAALIEFKNALQRDPEYADARWQLAKLYVTMGDGAAATSALGKSTVVGCAGTRSHADRDARINVAGKIRRRRCSRFNGCF